MSWGKGFQYHHGTWRIADIFLLKEVPLFYEAFPWTVRNVGKFFHFDDQTLEKQKDDSDGIPIPTPKKREGGGEERG